MENNYQKNVTLTPQEAEEYCAYKRQKKIAEITSAMRRSASALQGAESAVKLFERSSRLRQVAVRMSPNELTGRGEIFKKGPVKIDCMIGGNGETFAKVKAYEAKCALRAGAREITLLLSPSLISVSRYSELRKEIRRVRRAAKKASFKVRLERGYPQATLSRIARLCGETGVNYLSLPYYEGCERLQAELFGGCLLEVSGVETLSRFKQMTGAGVGRIVTSHAWEIYTEWLAETEETQLAVLEKQKESRSLQSSGLELKLL